MPPSPTRAVGYVRLSRDNDDSTSVAKQRQIITATAEAKGYDLIDVVEDVDVSASKRRLDRPGLNRVRALVKAREADVVLVWRLDRLARSVVDFGLLLDEGLDVASCTEPLDTSTSMGRAMAEVLQVFAALESRTIGERVRSAIAYRVGQGDRWRGGSVPYGYRSVPHESGDGRTLVVDAEEAAFVRAAADIVLGGGSLYSAMQMLNDSGSRPRRAEAWSLSSLRVVLTGDAVLGRQTRNGAPLRGDDGLIVAPWEPVLPLADVERLRAMLTPTTVGTTRRKASRLLSGLMVCATCGRRVRVNSRRNSGGASVESYGCRTNGDGKRCDRPASVNADQVEAFVEAEFLRTAGSLPVTERREVVRDVAGLADVEEAIRHTTDAMRDPGADLPALVLRLQALRETRDSLATRPAEPVVEEIDTGHTFAEAWEGADTDGRRALLVGVLRGPIVLHAIGRGRRGVDADRVAVPWPWTAENAEADYLTGQTE